MNRQCRYKFITFPSGVVSVIWYFIILPQALSRPLLNAGFETGNLRHEIANSWMPTHKPTELSRIKQKFELNIPALWWVSIQPTWLHCDWLSHLALAICLLLLLKLMLWHRLAIFESRGNKLSSSAEKLWLKTWHDRGYTGQLSARLGCTGVNFNTRAC